MTRPQSATQLRAGSLEPRQSRFRLHQWSARSWRISRRSQIDAHPYTVVSLDYIKADRRRDAFARDLIVVSLATYVFDLSASWVSLYASFFTLSKRKGLPHLSGSRPRDRRFHVKGNPGTAVLENSRHLSRQQASRAFRKHLVILLQPRNGSIDKF